MPRVTLQALIEGDLGYCCVWFFLSRFRRTRLVADRLGVTDQAVRQARHRCTKCEERPTCMHKVITMQLTPRKPREES